MFKKMMIVAALSAVMASPVMADAYMGALAGAGSLSGTSGMVIGTGASSAWNAGLGVAVAGAGVENTYDSERASWSVPMFGFFGPMVDYSTMSETTGTDFTSGSLAGSMNMGGVTNTGDGATGAHSGVSGAIGLSGVLGQVPVIGNNF